MRAALARAVHSGQRFDIFIEARLFGAVPNTWKLCRKEWETDTLQLHLSLPFIGMTGGFRGFSPDGRTLVVGRGNLIAVYTVPDGRLIKTLTRGGTGAVRFSPDGLWLAQRGPNGIALWHLSTALN